MDSEGSELVFYAKVHPYMQNSILPWAVSQFKVELYATLNSYTK